MARNLGLDNVDTEYMAMVDSDDWIHPCYIEHLLNVIKESDCDIAYCMINGFYNDSDINKTAMFDSSKGTVKVYSQEQIINCLCSSYEPHLVLPVKLYKSSVFKCNRYPAAPKNYDEWLIHHLFLNSKRIAISKTWLYFCRLRQNSQTRSFSLDNFSGILAIIDRKRVLKRADIKYQSFLSIGL